VLAILFPVLGLALGLFGNDVTGLDLDFGLGLFGADLESPLLGREFIVPSTILLLSRSIAAGVLGRDDLAL
jgi:hypothetical protein